MTLTTNFINMEHNHEIEQFIKSLVLKTFPDAQCIDSILINLKVVNDNHLPWKCHIYLTEPGKSTLEVESGAANYLTAFSQALMRIKRQFEKSNDGLRA